MHRVSRNLAPLFAGGSERYERKFNVFGLSGSELAGRILLHPSMFREAYPARTVNNVYLDTRELASLRESIAGDAERLKVRFRWYGDLSDTACPALELKRKVNMVGTKYMFPLAPLELGALGRGGAASCLERSALPSLLAEELRGLFPALVNRYRRKYYVSACGRFRLTLDTDMTYLPVQGFDPSCPTLLPDEGRQVLELKYAMSHDEAARVVTGQFPYRLSKHSKYVRGMQRVHALEGV